MPLLHRGELLERQRVDPAEHRQRALGGAQPLLLLLADVRRWGRASSSPSSRLAAGRHELVGAVVGDQAVGVEAELLERALLELLDAHPLLGAGHLVAVHRVDQLVVLRRELAQRRRGRRAAPARGLRGPARPRRARSAARCTETSSRLEHVADGGADRLGRPALADQPLAALGRAGAGLALLARGRARSASARPCRARARSSDGAQRQPGVHLAPDGRRGPPRRAARARSVSGSSSGASSARGQPLPRGRPARPGPGRGPPRPRRSPASSRSASPRAARAWEPN